MTTPEPFEHPTTELPRLPEDPAPLDRHSFWRRHRIAVGVVAGGAAAVGLGVAIGAMAAAQSTRSTAAAPSGGAAAGSGVATPSPTTTGSPGAANGRHRHAVRAVIVSENATAWTIRTPDGRTVSVTITPRTHFGTRARPETAAAFRPGDPVAIAGQLTADQPVATRVAHVRTATPAPTASATTS